VTWFSLYKIIFISELLLAELLIAFHYKKRKGFSYLFPLMICACYLFAFLYPEKLVNDWLSSSFMFVLLFCITILGIKVCFIADFGSVLFCAISGYTIQHISYLCFSLIDAVLLDGKAFISSAYNNNKIISFDSFGGMIAFSFVIYLCLYFFVYMSSYLLLRKYISKNGILKFKSLTIVAFILLTLLSNIVISDVFRYVEDVPLILSALYYILSLLLCATIIFLQINTIRRKDVEQEMEIMSTLYKEQQKQYKIRQETIDLINIKCHDFRHKIHEVGEKHFVDSNALQEMQNLISFYDAKISTGNKMIDTILTEKSIICNDKKISFTCIVDGSSLEFLDNGDVCALFGNILDNAVEACDKVTDENKRCISLIVEKEKSAVVIKEDNYYVGKIERDKNGLIETSKQDKGYHGFGIKSIREIVSRYDGILKIETDHGVFRLSIVFFR